MKLLNALVLAFFPFGAAAQTLDGSTLPSGCRDNQFLPMQGSIPPQIIQPPHDERGAVMLNPNPIATTRFENAGGAVQPFDENQTVKSSISGEDAPPVGGPKEQVSAEQATYNERGPAKPEPDQIASTESEKVHPTVQATYEP